ncbi:MAG: FtsX-like permease family protein [Bacillota bacterium]|nr:FtsX-like permease family protein [Bacillota bacterium]
MNLYQIALRNIYRRKSKVMFMLLGLIIGSATVVSVYSIVTAMESDIKQQLTDMGANIVITADRGELTFQYGGITIPELVFDAASLTEEDLASIKSIQDNQSILTIAPRLVGTASVGESKIVIAGTNLSAELIVKPWLQFDDNHEGTTEENGDLPENEDMTMDFQRLNLERLASVEDLENNQLVLGSNIARQLELTLSDILEIEGNSYEVIAVLVESGSSEDNQIFMNLSEAQRILQKPGELTLIEISSDTELVDEEILIGQLQTVLPHASVTGVRQAVMGRNELLASISRFGILTGIIVFITGLLVVVMTLSAAVRERTREIGIFRAIGFRSKHIFKIIITEGILISIIGGIIGYHLGLFTANLAGPLIAGTVLDTTWQILIFLPAVIFTALAGAIASLYPAYAAANLDPSEALRFI